MGFLYFNLQEPTPLAPGLAPGSGLPGCHVPCLLRPCACARSCPAPLSAPAHGQASQQRDPHVWRLPWPLPFPHHLPVAGGQCDPLGLSRQSCFCPLRPAQHGAVSAAGAFPGPTAARLLLWPAPPASLAGSPRCRCPLFGPRSKRRGTFGAGSWGLFLPQGRRSIA